MNSIRSRLLLWQISALLVTAMVVSALTYRLAPKGFNELQDDELEQIRAFAEAHEMTVDLHHRQRRGGDGGGQPAGGTGGRRAR